MKDQEVFEKLANDFLEQMTYTLNLILGDWSHDGHEKTETITIKTNLSKEQIKSAYIKGSNLIGVDLIDEVAAEYEDSTLSLEYLEKFKKAGFEPNEDMFYKGFYELDTEEYTNLYFFVLKKGNENFEYEIIENEDIDIGGYGLFH